MTIDEQELGRLLAETAALARPPRFTAGDLTRRAGVRRARLTTAALGAVAAVAAVAVIVPTALTGRGQSAGYAPPPVPLRISYSITVNGLTQAAPFGRGPADFVVKPGERLAMTVEMTMTARPGVTATALWMGITNGVLAGGPSGPPDMAPILVAKPRTSLGPGTYAFRLRWVAPADLRPGTSRQLSSEVGWSDGTTEREIAVFSVPGG